MATVVVQPLGAKIEIGARETLIQAAWRQGYSWPTVCRGNGQCGQCWVAIEAGIEFAGSPGPLEQETLRTTLPNSRTRGTLRLACQLRLDGDVVVRRSGVALAGLRPEEDT